MLSFICRTFKGEPGYGKIPGRVLLDAIAGNSCSQEFANLSRYTKPGTQEEYIVSIDHGAFNVLGNREDGRL